VRLFRLLALAVALGGLAIVGRPYVHGLSFVVRAADMQGTARRLADLDAVAVRQRETTIPTARGSMRARVYEPDGASVRTALLVSGLHPSGIDEPRLVRLARQLAANRLTIVTPDIAELSRFEITPAITDLIEQSALWLAVNSGLAGDGRVGMMGISFSGGLSIVAAGRPSLKDKVAYVFAFGGHDDLPRVLHYLCTGAEPYPSGARVPAVAAAGTGSAGLQATRTTDFVLAPHDYGVTVILLGIADRLVPAPQVQPLRDAIRKYLDASALDSNVDKSAAAREFAELRDAAAHMPEPSATLLRYVNERDVAHLGARLLPYIAQYGGASALSVSKSPKPIAPVYLLHGNEDNVIPSLESEYLADELRGRVPVHLLLSGLISHAEADRPPRVGDVLQLASFWGDLLGQ